MKLRRQRLVSTFLDPRRDFAAVELPLEVRWDPLTGQSCRLLPAGSIPPPARQDLRALAEQTRPGCPFCGDALERETPMFPPDVWPGGRVRCGEAVLFPNLVPYSKWSSVSVYSPQRHLLPIAEITPRLLADNLRTQVIFGRAVLEHDPTSGWISLNANQLPPSGSSIFHPHLQGVAGPVPSPVQRSLAGLPATAIAEYVAAEREGERRIASTGGIDWIASYAPIGPAEVRGFVPEVASPADLDDGTVDLLAHAIVRVFEVYEELGYQSFNLAIYGGPTDRRPRTLVLRLVARAYFGPLLRSDAMWSERLHAEAATDVAPERVAELGRTAFAHAPPAG